MELGSAIGFGQLGIFFTVTYLYVRYYGKHLNDADKWTAIWFGFDGLCHLLFEGVYLLFSFIGPIKNVDALIVLPWKEYSKSDFRWEIYDANVMSLEVLTVLVAGPMAIFLVWAILNNSKWRHPLQIIICTMELYGGWMTFGPEWITGSPNLDVSNFTYMWLYVTIPNGVWVVIPGWLIWLSLKAWFETLENQRPVSGKPAPQTRPASPVVKAAPKESSNRDVASPAPASPKARVPKKVAAAAALPTSPKGRSGKK